MRREDEDKTQNYQQMKQIYNTKKEAMLDNALNVADKIKNENKDMGNVIDDQNKHLEKLNNRLNNIQNKANKTNQRLLRYLENSSDCNLYIIIAVEAFLFILLMSI